MLTALMTEFTDVSFKTKSTLFVSEIQLTDLNGCSYENLQIMRSIYLPFLIILLACGGPEAPKGAIYVKDGVALAGYDPVSYFQSEEPSVGNQKYRTSYEGVDYFFANSENQSVFEQNPVKYAPAYGGWCAYAIAENKNKMAPDPTQYVIQDGKLLLFYEDFFTSLQGGLKEEWNTDPGGYKVKADVNWEEINTPESE